MIDWQLTQLWNSWGKELELDSTHDLCDTGEMLYQLSNLQNRHNLFFGLQATNWAINQLGAGQFVIS